MKEKKQWTGKEKLGIVLQGLKGETVMHPLTNGKHYKTNRGGRVVQ
jgi:hypothetical protein